MKNNSIDKIVNAAISVQHDQKLKELEAAQDLAILTSLKADIHVNSYDLDKLSCISNADFDLILKNISNLKYFN